MTRVQADFALARPLDEDFESVIRAHSVYGILRVTVAPALDSVTVEYDASRLMPAQVRMALVKSGVPVKSVQQ